MPDRAHHPVYEPDTPEDARPSPDALKAWKGVEPGLHGAVGSTDVRYARDTVPETDGARGWSAVAWRGERVSGQLALWTADGVEQARLFSAPLLGPGGSVISSESVQVRFVRYVLAKGDLVPDVVDDAARIDLAPKTTRPVWITIDVPTNAEPGTYRGDVWVDTAGRGDRRFKVELEVLSLTLPPPGEWWFDLDLWQNPYAVARWHRVPVWSPEHDELLKPHLRLLVEAGQDRVTAVICHDPWASQTYDPHESMVEWVKLPNGKWDYSYRDFDHYVELCAQCGLDGYINCYSMVPWNRKVRYQDAETGDYEWLPSEPGTPEYENLWRPFLEDFVRHLRERGWLERAHIAMDEIPLEQMEKFLAFVKDAAPELKTALAGANHPELKDAIDDWCVFIDPALDPAIARERKDRGLPTTFYICCGPPRPNTFTSSPPAESAWMGWYAAAMGYTGLLRWAYDSWTEDPFHETHYPGKEWPAGDCFVVYPGPRTSIRFERLREGIQAFEQVRIVREVLGKRSDAAAKSALAALHEALAAFTFEAASKEDVAPVVYQAREALTAASRVAAEPA